MAERSAETQGKVPLDGLEGLWDSRWEAAGVYRFRPGDSVYAVDTPPPSIVGREPRLIHVLTYTEVDCLVRYARMSGREPFFPVGWDDNDPAIEQRVTQRFGVRCAGPAPAGADAIEGTVPRSEFFGLAARVTAEDARPFEQLWRAIGISVDWSTCYTTLGGRACWVTQKAFLRELAEHQVRRTRPGEGMPGRWELRTGWDESVLREAVREAGAQIQFMPPGMATRLADVLRTRTTDLPISERRDFGIPVPLWYPVNPDGEPDLTRPIIPDERQLPVDPALSTPPGRHQAERGIRGGFVADPDVFCPDATASLTPLLPTGWGVDADLFGRTYPMAVRPQGHYIIQSWLFMSLLRGYFAYGRPPWAEALMSGWIRPARGEAAELSPMQLVERFGADGVRYWAASLQPGRDVIVDLGRMRRGRRLALGLLNLCRFAVLAGAYAETAQPTEPRDQALLTSLRASVGLATRHLERGRLDQALAEAERLLALLRRRYIPVIRDDVRSHADRCGASSRAALGIAADVITRMFAPFLPFAAEYCWSNSHAASVHRAPWPSDAELTGPGGLERE
jgi:valyl-tRNA synthetase